MLIVVLVIVRIESDFDKAEMLKPLYNFVNVTYPHHSIVLYFYILLIFMLCFYLPLFCTFSSTTYLNSFCDLFDFIVFFLYSVIVIFL